MPFSDRTESPELIYVNCFSMAFWSFHHVDQRKANLHIPLPLLLVLAGFLINIQETFELRTYDHVFGPHPLTWRNMAAGSSRFPFNKVFTRVSSGRGTGVTMKKSLFVGSIFRTMPRKRGHQEKVTQRRATHWKRQNSRKWWRETYRARRSPWQKLSQETWVPLHPCQSSVRKAANSSEGQRAKLSNVFPRAREGTKICVLVDVRYHVVITTCLCKLTPSGPVGGRSVFLDRQLRGVVALHVPTPVHPSR